MSYWLVGAAPHMDVLDKPEACLMPDDSAVQHTANALLRLTGWTLETYLRVFTHRAYLWHHPRRIWFGYGPQWAKAIGDKAKADGSAGVVLLGDQVAKAFGIAESAPLEWVGGYAFVPHPSAACRYWRNPESRAEGRAFFDSLLHHVELRP